jgi:hypothetical protein
MDPYISVDLIRQQWRPYLDDGVDDKRGIIDFRLTLRPLLNEQDFKRMAFLLTETITNTVKMFEKTNELGVSREKERRRSYAS